MTRIKSRSQLEKECTPAERVQFQPFFDNHARLNREIRNNTQNSYNALGQIYLYQKIIDQVRHGGLN